MLKPVSNRKSWLGCPADCPADNHARQRALFLYGTLQKMPLTNKTQRKQKLTQLKRTLKHHFWKERKIKFSRKNDDGLLTRA